MSNIFFYEPFYDFERLVEDAFNRQNSGPNTQVQRVAAGPAASRVLKPRMDLHEDTEKNLVTASFEFPGLNKDNIQIDIHNNRLTVSAESKQSEDREEHGYAVKERRYGKYSRTLQLPAGVKSEEIKASMENGVLSVTFPKSTPELASKKISIN